MFSSRNILHQLQSDSHSVIYFMVLKLLIFWDDEKIIELKEYGIFMLIIFGKNKYYCHVTLERSILNKI